MRIVLSTHKLTKNRRLIKTIRERYTRTTIPCSFACCSTPHKYPSTTTHLPIPLIVIPTKDILFHFLPLFQSKFVSAIILRSVLDDIKNISLSVYKRVKYGTHDHFVFYNDFFAETSTETHHIPPTLIFHKETRDVEFSNEIVDCAVLVNRFDTLTEASFSSFKEYCKFKKVFEYYRTHVPHINILVLNKDNIYSFPSLFNDPVPVRDLLCQAVRENTDYDEYYGEDKVGVLVQAGKVVCGTLYVSAYNCFSGIVHGEIKGRSVKIKISGKKDMNRAMNLDGVYVEIVDKEIENGKKDVFGGKYLDERKQDESGFIQNANINAGDCCKDKIEVKNDIKDYCSKEDCINKKTGKMKVSDYNKDKLEKNKVCDYKKNKLDAMDIETYNRDYCSKEECINKKSGKMKVSDYNKDKLEKMKVCDYKKNKLDTMDIETYNKDKLEKKDVKNHKIDKIEKNKVCDHKIGIENPNTYKSKDSNIIPDKQEVFGKIVGLYKRNYKPIIGTIDNTTINGNGPQYVLVRPLDRKIPKIRIRTSQIDELENKRILIRINEWKKDSFYPFGSYIKIIGKVGDRKSEIESILLANGIDYKNYESTFALKNMIDHLKYKIVSNSNHERNMENETRENNECLHEKLDETYKLLINSEKNKRIDLRDQLICSIDPPGCTDIDDALHCTVKNDIIEVGVHIADVSFFVSPDSLLDKESRKRGTSVYLTDRRIDMLPEYLSSNLCSLVENEDRLAFSVFWEIDRDLNIKKKYFAKTIIRNKKSFTYENAQNEMGKNNEFSSSLNLLNKIAKNLREKRFKNGSLELSSNEVKIHFDEKGENFFPIVKKIENKIILDTNKLVEEFMLLANITVAKEIYSCFKDSAMLRRHPKFADDSFDELKEYLNNKGIKLEYISSKDLNESIKSIEDGNFKEMIKKIITRSMNQAVYFSSGSFPYEEFTHYGLAMPIYTHFTSPIRRYADIIVHRQLEATMLKEKKSGFSSNEIEEICKNINYRNRNAMYASLDSDKLFIYLYMKNRQNMICDGFIIRIRKNGIGVYVPELGIEETIAIDNYEYCSEKNCFVNENETVFKVYDVLKVEISQNDELFFIKRKFDMKIVVS